MPKAREIIGHARDALLIFVIVMAGMYVLDHPEKVDILDIEEALRTNVGIAETTASQVQSESLRD
jgi:hypothetical protein